VDADREMKESTSTVPADVGTTEETQPPPGVINVLKLRTFMRELEIHFDRDFDCNCICIEGVVGWRTAGASLSELIGG
jgi:hypothetical protein